jgi:hypothetical protein
VAKPLVAVLLLHVLDAGITVTKQTVIGLVVVQQLPLRLSIWFLLVVAAEVILTLRITLLEEEVLVVIEHL